MITIINNGVFHFACIFLERPSCFTLALGANESLYNVAFDILP